MKGTDRTSRQPPSDSSDGIPEDRAPPAVPLLLSRRVMSLICRTTTLLQEFSDEHVVGHDTGLLILLPCFWLIGLTRQCLQAVELMDEKDKPPCKWQGNEMSGISQTVPPR